VRTIGTPAGGVSVPAVAAGPHGAVYAAFLTGGYRHVTVEVVTSSDGGQRYSVERAVAGSVGYVGPGPGVAAATEPSITVDRRSGMVDVAHVGDSPSGSSDVLLVRSADHGGSWQASTVAAAPPGRELYFQPQVAVDDAGGVDASFLALSHAAVNVELARSANHGADFASPTTVTDSPFAPSLGVRGTKLGAWWIGDYQGLAAGSGVIYPVWNDTRTGRLEIFAASVPAG
jgi:hypothetical protein